MRWVVGLLFLVCSMLMALSTSAFEDKPLVVPAFTAYCEPEPEALFLSEAQGITGWKDSGTKIVWYGYLKSIGMLHLSVKLRLPKDVRSSLRLTVANRELSGAAIGGEGQPCIVDFGSIDIQAPGYYRFVLQGLTKEGATFGEIEALLIDGKASEEAHFNLKERRNAASVHLSYPLPANSKVTWFYNEVTVKTDPIWSYYMACGFRRGYFGIQVNSAAERRIIFSVWDSGNEAVDRNKVDAENRVQLLSKGEGVVAGGFGNEGTGGHSHLVYLWKTGQTYRFLVIAQPEGTHTIYSGYFYFPEKRRWSLIARFRAPKDGGYLKGLYSFNENFGGANGQQRRLAEFGNQWVKTVEGDWIELLTARFSHDPTGKEDRLDYGAGVVQGRFYLSNGGFIGEPVHLGDEFHRPAAKKHPMDIEIQKNP